TQRAKAETLRELHARGILNLPNAWDAASAALIARAGAHAIATTSGGVAWSVGRGDGQGLTRAEMIERVREIVAAVVAERAATELLTTGTYTELGAAVDFATMNSLFNR